MCLPYWSSNEQPGSHLFFYSCTACGSFERMCNANHPLLFTRYPTHHTYLNQSWNDQINSILLLYHFLSEEISKSQCAFLHKKSAVSVTALRFDICHNFEGPMCKNWQTGKFVLHTNREQHITRKLLLLRPLMWDWWQTGHYSDSLRPIEVQKRNYETGRAGGSWVAH